MTPLPLHDRTTDYQTAYGPAVWAWVVRVGEG
jgi:hypothetical protein